MMKKERRNGRSLLPELLAPAGNLEKLKTAIHYGADAVYLGGKELSLRAKAGNFTLDEVADGVAYAHERGRKVYATVNVLAHNSDIEGVEEYLDALRGLGVDGLIIADPGILRLARQCVPEIPIHLSTQANVTNHVAAHFWLDQGVRRLNLARELSFAEMAAIRARVDGELEVFVHGSLCISYSGRCLLSSYMTARDANRGNCSHPCRFNYRLSEEKRPGQYFPVEEDERGTYIFNSKDLCLLARLPELVALGVDSLKIEGRMKSIFYVGGVVRVYRAALDYLSALPQSAWNDPAAIRLPDVFAEEIGKTGTRGITENFWQARPSMEDMLYDTSRAEQQVEPVAVIRRKDRLPLVEIRNRVELGEHIEHMGCGMQVQALTILSMTSEQGEQLSAANPGSLVYLATDPALVQYEVLDIMRRSRGGKDLMPTSFSCG